MNESIQKYCGINKINQYPYGEYFNYKISNKQVIFYRCNVRKTPSSLAIQYMIDHFNLTKIIVVGTCAGIDIKYKQYDIIIQYLAVQSDCTVRETEPLLKLNST